MTTSLWFLGNEGCNQVSLAGLLGGRLGAISRAPLHAPNQGPARPGARAGRPASAIKRKVSFYASWNLVFPSWNFCIGLVSEIEG